MATKRTYPRRFEFMRLHMASRQRYGFTIIELMVASTVMAIALLGVYTVLHQAMTIEGRASVRWQQQSVAESVAEHLARVLERCINLSPQHPALIAGPQEGEGVYRLTCTILDTPDLYATAPRPPIQQYRYEWPLQRSRGGLVITHRTMAWAGLVNVANVAKGADESEQWIGVPSRVLATHVDDVNIQFRSAGDSQARWRNRWTGSVDDVMIRIRVRVGEAEARRTVVPMVNGVMLKEN